MIHKKIVKNKKNISLTFVCFSFAFCLCLSYFFFCIVLPGTENMGGSIIWRGWDGH